MTDRKTRRASTGGTFAVKRVYEAPEATDGTRVLVDALWPRGLSKEVAKIDLWLKEVAPSTGLRTWFGHDPDKWEEFRDRYKAELKSKGDALSELRALIKRGRVTLLFAARDVDHNNALVLEEILGAHTRR